MRRILTALAAIVAVTPATSEAATVQSTAYCEHGLMADGSFTRFGSVAMNMYRLGTRVRFSRSPYGPGRVFVVRDRIGWGSQADFWVPSCAQARAWGRRTVRVQVI